MTSQPAAGGDDVFSLSPSDQLRLYLSFYRKKTLWYWSLFIQTSWIHRQKQNDDDTENQADSRSLRHF